jgi:hypothetical protein
MEPTPEQRKAWGWQPVAPRFSFWALVKEITNSNVWLKMM